MAIKDAPTVSILPFDEEEAYNPDRPISSLIRTQLQHLHTAQHIANIPAKERTNVNINTLHTEREASDYIQKVTALLHKHGKPAATKSKPKKRAAKPAKKSAAGKTAGGKSARKKPTAKKRRPRK